MVFIFQVVLSFLQMFYIHRFDYLIKQFPFQTSAVSFTFDEEEQTGPQVHFTLPVQLK